MARKEISSIVQAILSTANAEEYSDLFAEQDIDARTLKILDDEDLQVLGVVDEEKRRQILHQTKGLYVQHHTPPHIIIDTQYIEDVLYKSSSQLTRHLAALTVMEEREIIIHDIELSPATKCLQECLQSLEKTLITFEKKYVKQPKNKSKNRNLFIFGLLTTGAVYFGIKRFNIKCNFW